MDAFGFDQRLLTHHPGPFDNLSRAIPFSNIPVPGDQLHRIFIEIGNVDGIHMQVLGAMRKGLAGTEITFYTNSNTMCGLNLHRAKVKISGQYPQLPEGWFRDHR